MGYNQVIINTESRLSRNRAKRFHILGSRRCILNPWGNLSMAVKLTVYLPSVCKARKVYLRIDFNPNFAIFSLGNCMGFA